MDKLIAAATEEIWIPLCTQELVQTENFQAYMMLLASLKAGHVRPWLLRIFNSEYIEWIVSCLVLFVSPQQLVMSFGSLGETITFKLQPTLKEFALMIDSRSGECTTQLAG
jgi:hypothetical protein